VVIVGGGFSGAAVAYHLACRGAPIAITVIEPRPVLGAGLAYSTVDPAHRINVPATMMSLDPSDPDHLARWIDETGVLEEDPEARLPDGRTFPRRAVIGRYVGAQLAPFLASGRIEHLRDRAAGLYRVPRGHGLTLASGRRIEADLLVLAASHPPPHPLPILAGFAKDDRRIITDPWADNALAAIRPEARVLIIGTGLTMVDVVASLDRRGHAGPITAISRRGQRSRSHASGPVEPFGDIAPARSALALLTQVRREIARAAGQGLPWQAVLSAVRLQAQALWAALPELERRRFLRHLRPFWDTHRFRIAPQLEAVLARRQSAGTFTLRAASVRRIHPGPLEIEVDLLDRRTRRAMRGGFDAVVMTTGPAHDRIFDHDPVMAALRAEGLVSGDPLGLGLHVDGRSRAIGPAGRDDRIVLVAGPLARGRFGELMGLPEVTRHAADVAETINSWAVRGHHVGVQRSGRERLMANGRGRSAAVLHDAPAGLQKS
jgi:uncharacterized NAD(P)/FAD-binding protein YdhS